MMVPIPGLRAEHGARPDLRDIESRRSRDSLARIGVDHVGVLVGDGSFPREQSIESARRILSAVPPPSKGSALCLSADLNLIERIVLSIRPSILHLGHRLACCDQSTSSKFRYLRLAGQSISA